MSDFLFGWLSVGNGAWESLTYRELLSGDACVHHSFVHALQSLKIGRCNEHHVRHELRSFQYLQSLRRGETQP